VTSSNRTQLALVRESTAGTTPNTPRMRTMRITGESLSFAPNYVDSDELRADRMLGDPIKNMQASSGGINFELSYPVDNSPLSEVIRSAMFNPWTNTPTFDNDGTADSVVTDAGTVANTYALYRAAHRLSLGTWCAQPVLRTPRTTKSSAPRLRPAQRLLVRRSA
jgi:hypothetical protein